jgi:hypothetical protein
MTVRGSGDTLVVAPTVTDRGLGVAWNRLDDASAYRVRLFTRSGDVIVEEELADTSFVLSWEKLPARSDDSLFWQVQALDHFAPLAGHPRPRRPAPAHGDVSAAVSLRAVLGGLFCALLSRGPMTERREILRHLVSPICPIVHARRCAAVRAGA